MKQNTVLTIIATILATAAAAGAAYVITGPNVPEGGLVPPAPLPSPQAMPSPTQPPTRVAPLIPDSSDPAQASAISTTVPTGTSTTSFVVVAVMISVGVVALTSFLHRAV